MKKIFTCTLLLAHFICVAQNYSTGKQTLTFTDPLRNNRQVATELYYPADAQGDNVPLAAGTATFPVVVFGHGFVISTASYTWLADSLAQHGYIVALPSTESGILPSHADFGKDLAFLSAFLLSLNNDPTSFLYTRVTQKVAVGGHSMGGGASFLAAAGNNSINALFNFAAAETNPSAITAASSITAPSLIFSGSSDCIVPPATQQSMYANLAAACKTYINITDALHCQYANNNGTCSLGQLLSGCNSSSINTGVVFSKVTALLIPFLDFYLKTNCSSGDAFVAAYLNATGITKTQSCLQLPTCGPLAVVLRNFTATQKAKVVELAWSVTGNSSAGSFELERSMDGIKFSVFAGLPVNNTASSSAYSFEDKLPYPGTSYYRLKIINESGTYVYSNIVKIVTKARAFAVTKLYPNPLVSTVNLELFAAIPGTITATIVNNTGQAVLRKVFSVNTGLQTQSIIGINLPPGFYTIQFKDEKGNVITTEKMVKK